MAKAVETASKKGIFVPVYAVAFQGLREEWVDIMLKNKGFIYTTENLRVTCAHTARCVEDEQSVRLRDHVDGLSGGVAEAAPRPGYKR